jgi:TPR repeat protein
MVTDILKHFGMPPEYMDVKVEYIGEDVERKEIGTYSQNDPLRGTVVIRIKPSYMYDTVISIAAHECAHHYLFHHNVRLEETLENERLTDIAVIYLGCGFYYSFGSNLGTTVSRDWNARGQEVTTTTKHRLGYLKAEEFEFAHSEIRKMREAHEREIAEKRRRYREQALRLLAEYQRHMRQNNELVYSARGIKLICEEERNVRLARIFFNRQTEDPGRMYESLRDRLQKAVKIDDLIAIHKSIKSESGLLQQENEYLAQCLRLSQYQSLMGDRIHEYLTGITELIKSGNVFAMYEKMKFYASTPDSNEDAKALFKTIEKRSDGDALLILGRCCHKGIGIEKNDDMAKYYFYNSWLSGSENAKSELVAMEEIKTMGTQRSGFTA